MMTSEKNELIFKMTALTDIWTGGANPRDGSELHLTGIRGSLRWWYEAIVRGCGGYACDPTDTSSHSNCSLEGKALDNFLDNAKPDDTPETTVTLLSNAGICPACQMFGCNGWSAKFNLSIKNLTGDDIQTQIKAGPDFYINISIIKDFIKTEYFLWKMAIFLIANYGSIGGKTTKKPAVDERKIRDWHKNYGLIKIRIPIVFNDTKIPKLTLTKQNHDYWPNIKNFWFIPEQYMDESQINMIVGRDLNGKLGNATKKNKSLLYLSGFIEKKDLNSRSGDLLKSEIDELDFDYISASKKIFSFDEETDKYGPRCWGYLIGKDSAALIEYLNSGYSTKIKNMWEDALKLAFPSKSNEANNVPYL